MNHIKYKVESMNLVEGEEGEKAAFGDEVHFFLHVHLRGYDRFGTGKQMDASYYDKYGAPVTKEDTWTHGHFIVEKTLSDHFNICTNPFVKHPLVAGYGGGAHLYKEIHDGANGEPWNWTGWVPRQTRWLSHDKDGTMHFHRNRYFLTLRGNEIQNNLWDYHPHEQIEEEKNKVCLQYAPSEEEYIQISPKDKYRGGYFYFKEPKGRYLHVMALRTHHENWSEVKRYNYIVHPLAYRAYQHSLPDASVDGIQWSIMEIAHESNFNGKQKNFIKKFIEHFMEPKNWGDRVHAMELFNDFTYFYSYQPAGDYKIYNGELMYVDGSKKIVWFDTYPLEYCEFLIENALARGTYLQILSANDAFYNRNFLPPDYGKMSDEERKRWQDAVDNLISDPKGDLKRVTTPNTSLIDETKRARDEKWEKNDKEDKKTKDLKDKALKFFKTRPYQTDSVFGYTALIDTEGKLKNATFPNKKTFAENLEAGEEIAMDFLIQGRFFSHTGVYDIFKYTEQNQKSGRIPFVITGQANEEELCYILNPQSMEMKFTFQAVKNPNLIWRYSIEQRKGNARETVNGYFKLAENQQTILDLTKRYNKADLKWVRFTAFDPENPMRRAWFNPITGPAFVVDRSITLPELNHRIAKTKHEIKGSVVYVEVEESFEPTVCSNERNLMFEIPKCNVQSENYLYAYFAQGNSLQAEHNKDTKHKAVPIPERILQNIQGYFPVSSKFPTLLDMKRSWDSNTVDNVFFYGIDDNAQPFRISVY